MPAVQRRESILVAATQVFAVQGYRRGTVATIAERIGVSEPVVFQNFGTKAALFDDEGNATPVTGAIPGNSMVIMAANQRPNPQIGIVADNVYYVLDTGANVFSMSRNVSEDVGRRRAA